MQRFFDLLFSSIALVVLSPFLLPIMFILRLTGEGEVFYRQRRIGCGGTPFDLLKFATMLKESPRIGAGDITVRDDPRVLPVGRFLRKSKLNELPQLWNVLRGDLSLIGPRPMIPNTFAMYSVAAQTEISKVLPGLSGVGSIVFRDEERLLGGTNDPVAFYREKIVPYKEALECWYVSHRSMAVYFQAIALTVLAIFIPANRLSWKVWPDLPLPPEELK